MTRRRQADRTANADYMREYRRRRAARTVEREPPPHGSVTRYRKYGCHCEPCRLAQRDAMREYRTGDRGPGHNLRRSPYDAVERSDET